MLNKVVLHFGDRVGTWLELFMRFILNYFMDWVWTSLDFIY